MLRVELADEFSDQDVIIRRITGMSTHLQLPVDGIDYIARHLRRQNAKIIGQDNKYKAQ